MSKLRAIFINIVGVYLLLSLLFSISYYVGEGVISDGIPHEILKSFVLPVAITIIYFASDYLVEDSQIQDGVTLYGDYKKQFKNINLLVSYISQEGRSPIELVNLESGETLKEWTPDMDEITDLTSKGFNRLSEF